MVINIMKNLILSLVVLASFNFVAHSAPVFSETFTYPNGPLLGQGTPAWTITGTSVVNPLQVSSGVVPMANTGQDAYRAFDSAITPVDGTSFYYGLTLNLSAAGTGDMFAHTTPTVGNTTSFYVRLYAQASGTGYVLGYLETSGTGSAVNYGTTVLDFNTPYNVAVAYDFVAGPTNDTARVYINPTSNTELDNTAYITDTWTTATAEATNYAAFNLRQGGGIIAPTLNGIDNIAVSTLFSDVAQVTVVPEPSTYALLGMSGLALLLRRRFAK